MKDQSLLGAQTDGVRGKRLHRWLSFAVRLIVLCAIGASEALAGPVKFYVLAPEHTNGDLAVMSLEPGNTITVGLIQLSLEQYDTGTIPAADFAPGDVIQGTGAFVVGSNQSAADLLAPDSFAGTSFAIPHVTGQHKYFFLSPSGAANVTVRLGANTYNVQASQGVVNEFDAGSDNTITGRVTSDQPIVLAHVAYVSSSARDAYPVPPVATELVGIRSQNAVIGATTDGTSATVYASDGTSATYVLNAGEKATIAVGASNSQGQGSALRIVSNYPITAVQYDDGDGNDMTGFWAPGQFGRRIGIPVGAQYVAVACTQINVSVTLYKGSTSPETQTCSSSGNSPGKLYFGASTSGSNVTAGWYVMASQTVYAMYEAATPEDEENNLGLAPPAGPTPPTLDTVSSPTTSNPQSVSGTAGANQAVRLYVNGKLQATTTANGSGSFSFNAELIDGNNVLYATAVISGNESDPSNAVSVVYNNTIPRTQSGTISGYVVWTPGSPATPYTITANLTVAAGAKLVLQPGTTLKFANGTVLTATGELKIPGTAASPVILTSNAATPVRGSWTGVLINSNAGSLIEYALIEYTSTGVNVAGVAATVRNSTIRYFSANGVYVSGAGAAGALIQNNTIDNLNDTGDCIETNSSSPTIQGNTISNCQYGVHVTGAAASPTVNGNNIITGNDNGMNVNGAGVATSQPVVTGNQIFGNDLLNYRAFGYGSGGSGIKLNATGNWWGSTDPTTIGNKIEDLTDTYTSSQPTVDYSNFLDGPNGSPVPGNYLIGRLTTSTTLSATTYEVLGVLFVNAGTTLTIPAGAVLRFHTADVRLVVDGTLQIQGSASSRVRLTSGRNSPAKGDWYGIIVRSTATNVSIDHAIIEWTYRAVEVTSAAAVVSNALIQNFTSAGIWMSSAQSGSQLTGNYIDNYSNTGDGIYLSISSPTIQGNRIYRTNRAIYLTGASNPTINGNILTGNNWGIYLYGANSNSATAVPNPTITGNDIFGNTNAQVEVNAYGASNPVVINATGNWWGTATPQAGQQIKFTSGSPSSTVNFSNPATAPLNGPTAGNITLTEYFFSPNGDAVKDTTTVQGTLSQSTSWTATIKTPGGSVVRTMTGSGTSITAVWNGQDGSGVAQPDGVYDCEVTVPGSPNPIVVGSRLATLDNTPPAPGITSPAASSTLQNVVNVAVNGTASDVYLVDYTLDYGAGGSPSSWITINSQTTGVTNGLLGTWVVSSTDGSGGLPSGLYTLRTRASDKAGNTGSVSIPVTIDNIFITGVTQNLQLIRPLLSEQLQVGFTLSAPATAYLRIYPEQGGALVKEISQVFATGGAKTLSWDGKNSSTQYVTDEAYSYVLYTTDGTHNATYDPPDLTGTGSGSGTIDSAYNANRNDFWKMNYTLAAPKGRVRMEVTGCGISGTHAPYDWVPFLPGTFPVMWDGRDQNGSLVSGSCNIYFDVPDKLKPASVIVKGTKPIITGNGTSPNIEVKSNPYKATHSFEQISKITYRVDHDSYVTLKLLPPGISDPASPQAIILVNNELKYAQSGGSPADHVVEWKGYQDTDTNDILVSSQGTYTFTIQATGVATGVSTLYRGALQLWQ